MKIEKLTLEQKAKMIEVRDYWTNYIFSCKNSLNREQAKLSIDWLYKFCGLDSPIVIFVDSPLACQYASVYAKEFAKAVDAPRKGDQVWDQVRAQVGNQVWDQVWDQVRAQVGNQVWDQVGAQVWDQVRAQVGNQVWDQVGDQVWAQVGDQVWAQVGNQVGNQVWDQVRNQVWAQVGAQYENFSSYGNASDYSWISFYDFFTQIGVINHKDFNEFKKLISFGIYDTIQLNGFCIVSNMPISIKRNEQNRLHSIDSPAISFKDGYFQHYINGRFISQANFDKISNEKYTINDFVSEKNEEVKSACIALMQEKFGDEYMFRFFSQYLKETDTYVDKKDKRFLKGTTGGMNVGVYTLFKGEINNTNVVYVRCFCPSTDRMFFLGVDESCNTAKDAIASLYRIPRVLEPYIKNIRRQGERFSTTFTEKGKERAKTLTQKEISDTVALLGEKYFSLMEYEY